mmetsp:Transcript_3195/g.5021  ORF Transcript_3195/g.5021 Transcript_3195/m.5021 type:complete len:91 (+) Transcript_3195:812-1084(+)
MLSVNLAGVGLFFGTVLMSSSKSCFTELATPLSDLEDRSHGALLRCDIDRFRCDRCCIRNDWKDAATLGSITRRQHAVVAAARKHTCRRR